MKFFMLHRNTLQTLVLERMNSIMVQSQHELDLSSFCAKQHEILVVDEVQLPPRLLVQHVRIELAWGEKGDLVLHRLPLRLQGRKLGFERLHLLLVIAAGEQAMIPDVGMIGEVADERGCPHMQGKRGEDGLESRAALHGPILAFLGFRPVKAERRVVAPDVVRASSAAWRFCEGQVLEWTDEGIVLGVRRHGEGNAIVELLTRHRGRHLGMVRGGGSRRLAPVLQPGNSVTATWRARLDEHMGNYALEPSAVRAAVLMEAPHAAFAFTHMAQLLHLLPERDPHEELYLTLGAILDALGERETAGMLLARFELAMLTELGFGLELETCAATGQRDDLAYVSPRSGRAVCRTSGAPYHDRLFPLPAFLVTGARPSADDVEAALTITGHFLLSRALEPRGLGFSETREAFLSSWRRAVDQRR